jgi:hypothetical protein
MVRQARLPLLTFALLATGIYATAVTMMRVRPALRHPDAVSLGLLFDLLLTVPLAYYLLAVRRAGWPARTLIPLFLFSLTGAALVLPDQREMLKRLSEILSTPAELGLLAWIAVRTVRSLRSTSGPGADDMLEQLRTVAREVLPMRRVAEAIAFEMAVLYYALFGWRPGPGSLGPAKRLAARRARRSEPGQGSRDPGPAAARVFTYHRTSGYGAIVFALLMVTAAETIPVHILLLQWSHTAAWLLTALSVYGLFWFLADYRATRLRPIVLDGDTLVVRTGLRWTVRIPRAHIAAVHTKPPRAERVLRTNLPMTKPLWIELTEPVTAQGPYGIERQARWVSVAVDEAEELRKSVAWNDSSSQTSAQRRQTSPQSLES